MPANFKTYESQARLLAAVVAAHPGLKLDYKAIAKHFGSDMSISAIEHRFRPVKKQAEVLQVLVRQNQDTKDVDVLDKDEIAKFFGESTPDGIQFQFRSIKKEAEAMRKDTSNGQGAGQASAKNSSVPATPRKRNPKAGSTVATPAMSTPRSTGSRTKSGGKRKQPNYKEDDSKESSGADIDFDQLDVDPMVLKKKVKTTPSRTGIAPRHGSAMSTPTAASQAPATASPSTPATSRPGPAAGGPLATAGSRVSPSFGQTPSESDFSTVPTPSQPVTDPFALQDQSKTDYTPFPQPDFGRSAMGFGGDSSLGAAGLADVSYSDEFVGSFNAFDDHFDDNGEI